jgi:small-conductance mechanosensitive channel
MEFLALEFWGNTIQSYIFFFAAMIALFVAVHFVGKLAGKAVAAKHVKTDAARAEAVSVAVKRYLLPILYFSAFYLCTKILTLTDMLQKILTAVSTLFAIVLGAVFLSSLAGFFFNRMHHGKDESGELAVKWMTTIAKILIWGLGLVLFLDNIGVKVTSLVTGLGIGGVAIAFAAQSVLTDIFCFFTIFFDKPFEIGDFIIAGEQMGTVEHIGVKTTRLRALSGEQLVFSNADLTGSRIRNYKTMEQRRIVFTLGVTYDTPAEKLRRIPGLIQEIVESVEDVSFGRAHFSSYGPYSLNFEIVYFVLSSDYDRYMDINQQVNLKIKEAFERLGVEFAFPTQSILLEGAPSESKLKG